MHVVNGIHIAKKGKHPFAEKGPNLIFIFNLFKPILLFQFVGFEYFMRIL